MISNCSYYNRQWNEAQSALYDLLQQELPAEPPKPEKVPYNLRQYTIIVLTQQQL